MTKSTLSAVIPVYNEQDNVVKLYEELNQVLKEEKRISNYEIIFVNDGSRDKTQQILEDLKFVAPKIKIIQFRKNFGQTAALRAGFELANGDLIVTMDGDLQNDPRDIPRLIDKLNQGYEVVSGWRYKRNDKFTKRMASRMMNNLRSILIGDNLHDYGCSLKIYRKDCIKDLELFGELHRYITAYLSIKGYRIGEIKVNHRPRRAGKTKYKFNRGINGVLDLFYLKFWSNYSDRPLHLFGRLGIYQWVLAGIIIIEQIIKALLLGVLAFGPLLALASMLSITGLLFIIFGFLSETTSRIYLTNKKVYSIKKTLQ